MDGLTREEEDLVETAGYMFDCLPSDQGRKSWRDGAVRKAAKSGGSRPAAR